MLLKNLPLPRIDISKSDVDDPRRVEAGLDPLVEGGDVGSFKTHEERDGAAVQVSRVGGEGGIDVGVSVDPDQARVGVLGERSLRARAARRLAEIHAKMQNE